MEPAKLTKLVRGELDWIVMKSLEKDRNRRYETANGFARDIQRYLADEPVEACPPSARYRLRKFARKNRKMLATAASVGLLLALLSSAGTAVIWQQKSRADRAYEGEKEQRQRAQHNLTEAFRVLDDIYIDMAEKRFPKQQGLTSKDNELLRKAMGFYEQFVEHNADDPSAREQMAKAYLRVSQINFTLGKAVDAQQAAQRAAQEYSKLSANSLANAEYTTGLFLSQQALGAAVYDQGRYQEALGFFFQALASSASLPPETRAEIGLTTGDVYHCIGVANERAGKPKKTIEASFRQQLDFARQLAEQFPRDPRARLLAGVASVELAKLREGEEAVKLLGRSIETIEKAISEIDWSSGWGARNVENLGQPAYGYTWLGAFWEKTDKFKEAEAAHRKVLACYQKLLVQYPNVSRFKSGLAQGFQNLGNLLSSQKRQQEAEEDFRKSVSLGQEVAKADARDWHNRLELGHSYLCQLGRFLEKTSRTREAEECYRQAVSTLQDLLHDAPKNDKYSNALVDSYQWLNDLLDRAGRSQDAGQVWSDARAVQREACWAYPWHEGPRRTKRHGMAPGNDIQGEPAQSRVSHQAGAQSSGDKSRSLGVLEYAWRRPVSCG